MATFWCKNIQLPKKRKHHAQELLTKLVLRYLSWQKASHFSNAGLTALRRLQCPWDQAFCNPSHFSPQGHRCSIGFKSQEMVMPMGTASRAVQTLFFFALCCCFQTSLSSVLLNLCLSELCHLLATCSLFSFCNICHFCPAAKIQLNSHSKNNDTAGKTTSF